MSNHVAAGCDLSHIPLHGAIWSNESGRGTRYDPLPPPGGRLLSLPSVNQQIRRLKNAKLHEQELELAEHLGTTISGLPERHRPSGDRINISRIRFAPEDLEQNGITELRLHDYIKDGNDYWKAVHPRDFVYVRHESFDGDLNCSESDFRDFLECGVSPQVDRPIVALAKALEQNTSLTKLIIGPGHDEDRSVTLNLCCRCVLECCCCCLRFPHLVSVLFSDMALCAPLLACLLT